MYSVGRASYTYHGSVPSSTEARIEELCARIRVICSGPHCAENEAELRKLSQELRVAINDHLRLAKSSLEAKGAAIKNRDPEET
jgi:hypothetical protein